MKNMTKTLILALALALALAAAGAGMAAEQPGGAKDRNTPMAGKQQTACPVLGGQIDKKLYTDYQGQRVYFCCAGCSETFRKDPEAYLKKMREQGIVPEKSPAGK